MNEEFSRTRIATARQKYELDTRSSLSVIRIVVRPPSKPTHRRIRRNVLEKQCMVKGASDPLLVRADRQAARWRCHRQPALDRPGQG